MKRLASRSGIVGPAVVGCTIISFLVTGCQTMDQMRTMTSGPSQTSGNAPMAAGAPQNPQVSQNNTSVAGPPISNCKVHARPDSRDVHTTYSGGCKDGWAEGQGQRTTTGPGITEVETYTGQFSNGYQSGQGTIIWGNKIAYVGGWKNDVQDGFGARYDSRKVGDGAKFFMQGIYRDGKRVEPCNVESECRTPIEEQRAADLPQLRTTSPTLTSSPDIDAAAVYALLAQEASNSKLPNDARVKNSLASNLSRLFPETPATGDPFARRRAQEQRENALAGLLPKFIQQYAKPLNSYKVNYVGPAYYADYDFNTSEIVIHLCSDASLVPGKVETHGKANHGQTSTTTDPSYNFTCGDNIHYRRQLNRNAVVDAARNMGLPYPVQFMDLSNMDSDGFGGDRFIRIFLDQYHPELRIKMSAAEAEKLKKQTLFSSNINVSPGVSGSRIQGGANQFSFFTVRMDMAFEAPKARVDNGWSVLGIEITAKPVRLCIENIFTGESYFCGPIAKYSTLLM